MRWADCDDNNNNNDDDDVDLEDGHKTVEQEAQMGQGMWTIKRHHRGRILLEIYSLMAKNLHSYCIYGYAILGSSK